jgi:N-acetylglucosaminyl-diphospho-decaprenol L-rhamnosyltransferase
VVTPDLSIVVVNYNSGDDLLACLDSLNRIRAELPYEVTIADNGSTDGSSEKAEAAYPHFQFLHSGENLGFAAACNLGLARARGRHVMLLNPDTEVQPGALTRLVSALDDHPSWGIVGPRMTDQNGRPYPAARRFPTPYYLFCEYTRLASAFPRSRLFATFFYGDRDSNKLDEVDQIEGSALIMRGSARTVIGDLDPRFFLYFEEVDWCKRVREAGFEVHLVQEAEVLHRRATTMSRYFLQARLAHAESAMKYFQKHHGVAGLKKLRRWMRCALWIREWQMRVAFLLSKGERPRIRAEVAKSERAVYRRGLPL